jgi:nitrate/nitrite-specific signal transduction histidine kinase
MLFGVRWGSLRAKIIAWSFVPTVIILVAVALITFTAYQQVTQTLVIERDRELTRLAAGQLATELAESTSILATVTRMADFAQPDPIVQRAALQRARNRLVVFDGGVVILDTFGTVVAAEPERPEIVGQDWSNRNYFREMVRTQRPSFSDIAPDGLQGAEVIALAVPINGAEGEFLGAMVGMFRLQATAFSAFYGGIVKLRLGESGNMYLVDGNGRVIYHSEPEHIGEDFSGQGVVQQVLSGKVDALRTRDFDGQDIVAGFAPVPGTPWGLVTEESLSSLSSSFQGYQRFLLLLLVLGVVVPALVVTLGVGQILRPIQKLIGAAQEVARGNFGQSIAAKTGDEIEELAHQFNLMSAQLQESYAHLEQRVADRTRELATLNTVASVVSRSLELNEILENALKTALEALELEAGAIYVKDTETHRLQPACHQGLSEAFDHVAAQDAFALSARAAERGEPVIINDLFQTMGAPPPAPARAALGEAEADSAELAEVGYRSLASIPLVAKGQVEGVLTLASLQPDRFGQGDIDLLRSIGGQIGVAVENARLYRQAQQLAVVEERQRLARELHDSVTQSLYGAVLYAKAAAGQLTLGQLDKVAEQLAVLQDTTQEALAEMRLLIYELRPPVLEKVGLVAALQARLQAVEGRAGLKTEFKVDGVDHLPHATEEGLYRIAQEALNNALKHARARRIGVFLRQSGDALALEIADDGVGFEPIQASAQGGMGLSAMGERIAQLGGHLKVESNPGQGTRVLVELQV